MTDRVCVILAAGLGTRMRSRHPKAMHRLGGRSMLRHLLSTCGGLADRLAVVIGPDMPALAAEAAPHPVFTQTDRLGTAHAALQALPAFGDAEVAILYADNPLVETDTLRALFARRAEGGVALAMLGMRVQGPNRYGRVVTDGDGGVDRIVEWADASEAERAIPLCNAGVFCAAGPDLARWLRAVGNGNAACEYYLTDVVALARAEGRRVVCVEAPHDELRGVNSRAELAEAEAVLQGRLRAAAMAGGATLLAPETVFLQADTALGPDTVVGPHVVFGPGVRVEGDAEIRAFSHLEGCSVAAGAVIGPYARLRPGSVVEAGAHVGNFVELKAARLGAGAKANHLAYLGDAVIGAGSNVGAGTITANYDGVAKHRTTIGRGVFVGSNSTLVAPLSVGDNAVVTAGSTLTGDVDADAMAFARARQTNKPGRARLFRDMIRRRAKREAD